MSCNPGAAAVGLLLGGVLAGLAGCAQVTGLDSIQECASCLEGDGSQDGTMGADAGGDGLPGGDVSTGDAAADVGAPDVSIDRQTQDAAQQDAPAEGDAPTGDAPSEAAEAAGPCNPSTCVGGCCQGIDCVGGTADDACGSTGGACQDCTSLGDTCVGGACQAPSPNCPTTCAGCCDTSNACHVTPSAQYCPEPNEAGVFQAGYPCEDCVSQGYPYCLHDIVVWILLADPVAGGPSETRTRTPFEGPRV